MNVNFDHTVDWQWFADGLNKALVKDATINFCFSNPLRHPYIGPFLSHLDNRWSMETTLVGPGLSYLMARPMLADKCDEIIATYGGAAQLVGLIPWMAQVEKLYRVGYNVHAQVPRAINKRWLARFLTGDIGVPIDVVVRADEPLGRRGFSSKVSRACAGERALIWNNGRYYPCDWCIRGGMKGPVYAYGQLDEPFEKKGKQKCHLRHCPLDQPSSDQGNA